jgi:hypothetical protein
LMLFEVLVRRGQEQSGEKLKGLYPGTRSHPEPFVQSVRT